MQCSISEQFLACDFSHTIYRKNCPRIASFQSKNLCRNASEYCCSFRILAEEERNR